MDDDLIERINDAYDPEDVISILGLTTEQLTYHLHDIIIESRDKFEELDDADEDDELY